jgi:hypothetical protein
MDKDRADQEDFRWLAEGQGLRDRLSVLDRCDLVLALLVSGLREVQKPG